MGEIIKNIIAIVLITMAIILFMFGIKFLASETGEDKSLYEICLSKCIGGSSTNTYRCTELCNKDFKDTFEFTLNKTLPLIEDYINNERA